MQENRVQFLGWEDLLEKEMATHSSILAWEIPWMEELGGLQRSLVGSQELDMTYPKLHMAVTSHKWLFRFKIIKMK